MSTDSEEEDWCAEKSIVFEDVAKVDKTVYKREKPTLSYRKPKGSSRTQI